MSFHTLRNPKWTGGDVTISDDGDFIVVELRDVVPVRGYMVIDLRTGQIVNGHQWNSLFEAQRATELLRKQRKERG